MAADHDAAFFHHSCPHWSGPGWNRNTQVGCSQNILIKIFSQERRTFFTKEIFILDSGTIADGWLLQIGTLCSSVMEMRWRGKPFHFHLWIFHFVNCYMFMHQMILTPFYFVIYIVCISRWLLEDAVVVVGGDTRWAENFFLGEKTNSKTKTLHKGHKKTLHGKCNSIWYDI